MFRCFLPKNYQTMNFSEQFVTFEKSILTNDTLSVYNYDRVSLTIIKLKGGT